jgi:hypothetical protein
MLIGFGYVSDEAIYAKSLGLNVNVWWGTVLLGFGIAMLGYARQAASRDRS